MYALLAFAASFTLVFFTVMIVVGTLLGVLLAGAEAVAWIVRPAHQPDPHATPGEEEAPS